jgi:sugar phosphate isomerase/epimerase
MQFGARAYSLEDVKFLAEAGFAFAEIDWKDYTLVTTELSQLSKLHETYGIAYLAHGPNELNTFKFDEVFEVKVCQLIELASQLGITIYTQHLWMDPRFIQPDIIAKKQDLLKRWVETAARYAITLCIENLSEQAEHFAPAFQHIPKLRMTLDLGHGELLSTSNNTSLQFIEQFADRIHHVHLHDNLGGTGVKDDLHLPIGKGKIDFATILKNLRLSGYKRGYSLELKIEYVEQGRETIINMCRE